MWRLLFCRMLPRQAIYFVRKGREENISRLLVVSELVRDTFSRLEESDTRPGLRIELVQPAIVRADIDLAVYHFRRGEDPPVGREFPRHGPRVQMYAVEILVERCDIDV